MRPLTFLNILMQFIAVIHLTYAVFAMYNSTVPKDVLPIDSAFSGKFKYLTFWNVCLEAIYFCYAFADNIISYYDSTKPLRKIRDYFFISIVFGLSWFVSFTFWALYLVNRELVMPKSVDQYFPAWLNHSVHTCIVIYAMLELLTTYHKTLPSISTQCYGLWAVTVTYLIWCHVVYYMSDMWVYPILNELGLASRILFFAGCLALSTVFLIIGYHLNNFVWRKKIQDDRTKSQKKMS